MQPARITFIVMALFTHVAHSVMNPKSVKWTSGILTIFEKRNMLIAQCSYTQSQDKCFTFWDLFEN